MTKDRKQVYFYFVIPYIFISFLLVLIATTLWFLPSFSGVFKQTPSIFQILIPIGFYFSFKNTAARLPDVTAKEDLSTVADSGVSLFTTLAGVACSLMIALAINFGMKSPLAISKIDEVSNFPGQEYFHIASSTKPADIEESFYYTKEGNDKGGKKFSIMFHYGGLTGDKKSLYLFTVDDYFYGREYSLAKEQNMETIALRRAKTELNTFLKKGGYLKRVSEFHKIIIEQHLKNNSYKSWWKANEHVVITENPSSKSSVMLLFGGMFALLILIIPINAVFSKENKVVLKSLESLPTYFKKLFHSKYRVG